MAQRRAIVVGGGIAGLMAIIKLAESGLNVDLFSMVPARRSHSVCAQGGINAALNTKGEGDSPEIHFKETIYGGDFLANQPPVMRLCQEGPNLIYLLDRMGVMFNRTGEGTLDVQKRGGGTKFSRSVYAGATTGQQILYALDEQVRRYEADGLVRRFEGWEFLSLVIDGQGVCRGITAMDLLGRQGVESFRADAVVLATGGCGALFAKATTSSICNGSAASAAYQQGARYANGEFIQCHPTALPGEDKCRLVSESLRGAGARIWTYRDGKPWYFLEEWYPAFGNLVPRDIASRAIYKVCRELGLGIDGKDQVYLDVRHMSPKMLDEKFLATIEIYIKFAGEDPKKAPMKVFPAVHYSMGGLWVDYGQATNIKGLFAVGECEYQYHGANRLGANALLACLYAGSAEGSSVPQYLEGLETYSDEVPVRIFEAERKKQEEINSRIKSGTGEENPFLLYRELSQLMHENVTVIRYNKNLEMTYNNILELMDRMEKVSIDEASLWANQSLPFARRLKNMMHLALAITLGALKRNESRGAHYKPEFPERDDEHFLKTTIAEFDGGRPKISYEPVDISLYKPQKRSYETDFL